MDYSHLSSNPGIYKIISKIDNKIYIGSSVHLRNRANRHQNNLRQNKHLSKHLQNAYNLYGEENFDFVILEEYNKNTITRTELLKREQFYLDKLKPFLKENGYNTCSYAHSPNVGKLSDETKNKISRALSGRTASDDTRKRISNGRKNKRNSQEAIERMRKTKTGVKQSEESIEKRAKEYAFIGPDGIIYKGKNLKRFAQEHHLHRSNLKMVLSGKRKSHYGFIKYIRNNLDI